MKRLLLLLAATTLAANAQSVSAVFPSQLTRNASGVSIQVVGASFAAGGGAVVFFTPPGGSATALSTSFQSTSILNATVPQALLATAGTASVQVQNGTGPLSNAATLLINPSLVITTTSLPATTVGTNYSPGTTLNAVNGTAPYNPWSLSSGSLPIGLSINSFTGAITGVTSAVGTSNFTVQISDSGFGSAQQALSIVVNPVPSITTTSLAGATVGANYNQSLAVTGGTAPLAFALSGGSLPAGTSLNSITGAITGVTNTAGTSNFTVTVLDAAGATATRGLSIQVATAPSITTSTLPNTNLGRFYSQNLSATGGSGGYNFTVSSGSLPPGVSIGSGTFLSGTTTQIGTFPFTLLVTDSGGRTGSRAFSITVNPLPSFTSASMPATTVGASYSQPLPVTGGTAPYSYQLLSNPPLAPGLSLSSTTGIVSGVATTPGSFNFSAGVTDSVNDGAQQTLSILVNPAPSLNPTTAFPTLVGSPYSLPFTASGGTGTLTVNLLTGTLPPGLTFNSSTATISGTPTTAGTFNFTLRVRDSLNIFTDQQYSIQVVGRLSITTGTLPDGGVNTSYSAQVVATGGFPGYFFQINAGSLPPGLSMDSAGVVTGIPTVPGNYSFSAQVTDAQDYTVSRTVTISVIGITTASLPAGVTTQGYAASIGTTGGTPPLTFTVSSGSLPPGLTLNSASGAIGGTPTTIGTSNFVIVVSTSNGGSTSAAFNVRVTAPLLTISTSILPNGALNVPYSATVTATGGDPTHTWSIQSGGLPPGLALDGASGAITGTPTTVGTFRFQVLVTDSTGFDGRLLSITIDPIGLSITTTTLGPAVVGTAFTGSIAATGGVPPYGFSVASGSLPAGLSLANDGSVTGTPTTQGTTTFVARVTDSRGQTNTGSITFTVNSAVTIPQQTLPPATINVAYTASVNVTGGTAPLVFSVTSGNLPAGIALSSAGALSGTPTAVGSSTFTVQVVDARQQSGTQSLTISVAPELIITTASLPGGIPNIAYSSQVAATGGVLPYTFSLAGGSLPDGLSFSSAGAITGTPTRAATFPITVRVTDKDGRRVDKNFTIVIGTAPVFTTSSLPNGVVGQNYGATVAATGGVQPLSFSVTGGSLPPGISLDGGGGLSGVPSAVGSSSFTVRVSDAANPSQSATATFSITVAAQTVPTVTITGVNDTQLPATQPTIGITLNDPAPVPLTGSSTLSFQPDTGADDPAVVFSNGQRSANFSIAQGATNALFNPDPLGLQTGTVAGTITIVTRLFSNGVDVTPQPPPTRTIRIAPGPPVITAVSLTRTATSLQITVTGFSPIRSVASAAVTLVPAANANLQNTQFTVAVDPVFTTYFGSAASQPFGSRFTLVLPFNGDGNTVGSVRITLSNSQGTSNQGTAQ